ncbi:MAG TPA: MFS transporter [Xanthobacteraceae bacterium]|nr:MFS transporter [Xanthobacteraceae bacterium]
MARMGDWLSGPWRAVPVLGVTQIIAWGTIYYSPVLTVPLIAAEHGWSLSFTMAGLSVGLFVAGLASPFVGRWIDHFGGHVVMSFGSLVAAVGLYGLAEVEQPAAYLTAWVVLGLGLSASLYDAAFASLGRIFGAEGRRPITVLTLAGGFASTVGWPTTHFLLNTVGWRGTYLIYAVLLALVCAPLHALALPRSRAAATRRADETAPTPIRVLPAEGLVFFLVAAAFAAYAFVPSALSAHLLAIFERAGLGAATVVAIGALFGPAQVMARICELMFGRHLHPLIIARAAVGLLMIAFALLAFGGFSIAIATVFALMFGAANGLITITRGAVPLALFGAAGYGRLLGRIAGPSLVMQAAAPFVLAYVAEHASDGIALGVAAIFAAIALGCFLAIRRPAG